MMGWKHTTPQVAGRRCASEHCLGHTQKRPLLLGSTWRVPCQSLSWRTPWASTLDLCVASPAKCLHRARNRERKGMILPFLEWATLERLMSAYRLVQHSHLDHYLYSWRLPGWTNVIKGCQFLLWLRFHPSTFCQHFPLNKMDILTGITLGLLDKRSRDVTWRVWSSVHRTSSVNSTEHSGQKSSQVQSYRNRSFKHLVFKFVGHAETLWYVVDALVWYTYSGVLHFVYDVITCERYQTWWDGKSQC